MNRYRTWTIACTLLVAVTFCATGRGADAPAADLTPQQIYDRVTPSLVAVQYVWENELQRRELAGLGIVVSDDGLVMTSLAMFDISLRDQQLRLPDAQMKEFKILIPSQEHDADEIDAEFMGRDDRSSTAFVKAKSPQKWKSLKFIDARPQVGEPVYSVGMLGKNAAYKTYLTQGMVGASLRGETPHFLVVGGGLGGVGSPVLNARGEAIGFVSTQGEQQPFFHDQRAMVQMLMLPPIFFVPTDDFAMSISDPPTGKELALPWLGVPQQAMAGLNKDVAESLGLKNQPAVEIGDVIPGSPLEKAGVKPGSIVLKVNGKPLEHADEAMELPGILARQIRRMKVADTVTLTIMTSKDEPTKDVEVKLYERPKGSNLAERWYNEDLGFGVRSMVFMDSYARKLPADTKGVVVSIVKPQSAAQTARLGSNDLITELNGQPVADLEEFKKKFEMFRKEKQREAIVLVVLREGNTQTIRIEPPQ